MPFLESIGALSNIVTTECTAGYAADVTKGNDVAHLEKPRAISSFDVKWKTIREAFTLLIGEEAWNLHLLQRRKNVMSRKLYCLILRTMTVGMISVGVCAAGFVLQLSTTLAQEALPSDEFPALLQRQAAGLRASDTAPKTLAEWQRQRLQLRKDLERA